MSRVVSRGRWIVVAIVLLTVWRGDGVLADHRTPISEGFGANGPYQVRLDHFPSPLYRTAEVRVFRPAELNRKAPVIFFVPGYSNNNPDKYRGLITHMVSRGYAVVFTPYHLISGDLTLNEKRYEAIWEGMREAVVRYGESFDLERVGFVGHSYGAGAIFAMSLRGLEREGWGRQGLMLFSMAPWYHFQLQPRDYQNFPAHAKLVIQVYEDDKVNDHRLGRELFERINLPLSEKDFMMVRGDRSGEARIDAGHGAPESRETVDAIDFYAIYRVFDALSSYAFTGDEAGRLIALGNGGGAQRYMGRWANGQPIREMLTGDCVGITRSPMSFLFPSLAQAGRESRWFSRLLFPGRQESDSSAATDSPRGEAGPNCATAK